MAVDIGGTKISVAWVDPAGRVADRVDRPTDPTLGGEGLADRVVGTVNECLAAARAAGSEPGAIGVAAAGPVDPRAGTVAPVNISCWDDFPLADRLASATGLPTVLDLDTKGLARGQARWGAGRGVANFLAMVVSTGVGGGLVLDGRVVEGRTGNAGHVGHVVIDADPSAPECPCGGRGHLEGFIAGPALERRTGRPAEEADLEVRRWAGSLLGVAVASVAALADLDLVLVGGGVALGFGDPFFAAARESLAVHTGLGFTRSCRIEPVAGGPDAALWGAAAVAWDAGI